MPSFTDEAITRLFGREDAEHEEKGRLLEYFYRNRAYDNLVADLPIRLLVGHKGVGKSALMRVAHIRDQQKATLSLWVRPNDLHGVTATSTSDFSHLINVWKTSLTSSIWRLITQAYPSKVMPADVSPTFHQGATAIISTITDYFRELAVHASDAASAAVIRNYLSNNKLTVYIDDLDQGWTAAPDDIRRISALFAAVRDLSGSDNRLQFRIALRTDVYFLVRTSDESTDKIETNIVWLTWTNHDILALMAKRIQGYFGKHFDTEAISRKSQNEVGAMLNPVIEPRFGGKGKWENAPIHRILLSLTRKRPRDLVKLFHGAAKEAYKNDHQIITTMDLSRTFEHYSGERLQDLINEFKSELPGIAALLHGMRPTKLQRKYVHMYMYTNAELTTKLKNLIEQSHFLFTDKKAVSPRALAEFLYKIDFILARKVMDDDRVVWKYYDQNRYLANQYVDYGFSWEIHPAYRWALQPQSVDSIFKQMDMITEIQ